jgi:Pyruvate/2-oxoacid:ferredoxin oxidoreductase gamma subunit
VEREILLTGIGGQGVQLAATILARAATHEGRHVMTLGTYGGSMRGGNTDSSVLVADCPISSPPIVSRAWSAIAAHPSWWPALRAKLRPDAVAVWNAELFGPEVEIGARVRVPVEATRIANELGSPLAASLVLLGAFVAATGLVSLDAALAAMADSVPAYRREHLAKNAAALRAGFAAAPVGVAPAWPEVAAARAGAVRDDRPTQASEAS